uniref:Uncharacterized protein n=1 Tax=Rhizophagus irregularis (strain DAOM 181602 / DAOM 197198 / MUCL 43194) TaxID=747089 RepID=U9TIT9_RHIID
MKLNIFLENGILHIQWKGKKKEYNVPENEPEIVYHPKSCYTNDKNDGISKELDELDELDDCII